MNAASTDSVTIRIHRTSVVLDFVTLFISSSVVLILGQAALAPSTASATAAKTPSTTAAETATTASMAGKARRAAGAVEAGGAALTGTTKGVAVGAHRSLSGLPESAAGGGVHPLSVGQRVGFIEGVPVEAAG